MPAGLESWRIGGKCCIPVRRLLTLEMIANQLG